MIVNPDDSSTYKLIDRDGFDIKYLDNRRIEGDYFEDTVTIDGKKITKQQLGLAVTSVRPTGIMGLGFSANVAAEKPYPAIVDTMVSQGLIERAAFSLWLVCHPASSPLRHRPANMGYRTTSPPMMETFSLAVSTSPSLSANSPPCLSWLQPVH